MITRALHMLTDTCVSRRGKYITIICWIILTGILSAFAPKIANLYDNTGTQRIPDSADSQQANALLLKEFPSSRGTPAILVFFHASGITDEDRAQIKDVSTWLTSEEKPAHVGQVISVFTVPQAASRLLSKDQTTMMILVQLDGSSADTETQDAVKAIRHRLEQETAQGQLQAHLTGPAGIVTDTVAVFSSVDLPLLLSTVGLVFILLILLYRSPILALLPLIAVGIAQQVANALFGFAAQAGLFSISQMSTSIATVLLFGAGTDYSIFIASRFREELLVTEDKHLAMRHTMRAVGEAVTSSAGTVIVSLLTLLLAAIGLYSALGPTLAIAVFVMLLAGLTLVPALIVWLGRVAYWPLLPRYQTEEAHRTAQAKALTGMWGWIGRWTAKHRRLAVVGSTLLLVVFALGNIGSQPSFNFLSAFRVQTDSSRGYALLQDHFPAGTLAPTTVLIQLHGDQPDVYQHLVQLDEITLELQKVPGVAIVEGPTRPDGTEPIVDPATLQSALPSLPESMKQALRNGSSGPTQPACQGKGTNCPPPDPQLQAIIGAYAASGSFVSPDNSTVKLTILLKDDPYALDGIRRIEPLRERLMASLHEQGLDQDVTVHLAGQTSLLADTLNYNQGDTFLIVPLVLALVAIVLALLLRSLIAPLYLLAAVTLNFLAAIGVCTFFFQSIQKQDGFNYAIPLYTFIFLVSLGVDYTIFLMSRVREEAGKRGLEEGVPVAVARTGGVITSAGFILAGTFAVLTTLPLNVLYQLGICVAVGILLDTFVVRGFLIPGLVLLLGKWNWWPGKVAGVQEVSASAPSELALSGKGDQRAGESGKGR